MRNFRLNPRLNLEPQDVELLAYHMARLLPGQPLYVVNGVARYDPVESGVTARGAKWKNIHLTHRENCTASVRFRAMPWLHGDGVDIGCGLEKVTPDCIGIDSGEDFGDRCDADDRRDACDLAGYEDGRFDWVYSSCILEHLVNWERALTEWVRVLKKNGTMFIYLPWAERCRVHAIGETPGHVWHPSPQILQWELAKRGVDTVDADSDPDVWGCFVLIGRKK